MNKVCFSVLTAGVAGLWCLFFTSLPASASNRLIIAQIQDGLRIEVYERKAPEPRRHGVTLQAAHELVATATQNNPNSKVTITGIRISGGRNLRSESPGNIFKGYIYLDAMPRKSLSLLTLADDSSQGFGWNYRVDYMTNGRKYHLEGFADSPPPVSASGQSKVNLDVSALLDSAPAAGNDAPKPAATTGKAADLDFSALLGEPAPTPSQTGSSPEIPASSSSGNSVDDALTGALALRDEERERKAYVDHADALRRGLMEQHRLQRQLLAETARQHEEFDRRVAAEAKRRREAAEAAADNRRILGVFVGMGAGALAHKAGIGNAADLGAKVGISISRGDTAGALAQFSSSLNQGMNQRIAELEEQNRRAMQAQPQQISEGQRMYRETVRLSEANRQRLIAQGKLPNTKPPATVTAALNNNSYSNNSFGSTGPSTGSSTSGSRPATQMADNRRIGAGADSCTTFAGHWARYAGMWHRTLDLEAGCSGGEYCTQTLRNWNNPSSGYDWHCQRDAEIKDSKAGRITRWSVNGNTLSIWLATGKTLSFHVQHKGTQPWLDDMFRQSRRR